MRKEAIFLHPSSQAQMIFAFLPSEPQIAACLRDREDSGTYPSFLPMGISPPSSAFCFQQSPVTLQLLSSPLQGAAAFPNPLLLLHMLPFLPEGLHAALSFPLPFGLLILLPGSNLQLIIYTLARADGESQEQWKGTGFFSPFIFQGAAWIHLLRDVFSEQLPH